MVQSDTYCVKCGSKIENIANFCNMCGEKKYDIIAAEQKQTQFVFCSHCGQKFGAASESCPLCGRAKYDIKEEKTTEAMSFREYTNKQKGMGSYTAVKTAAIICYVCSGIMFLAAVIGNPALLVDLLILLGLTLGMHLGKNRACAICLLVYSSLSCIVTLISTGTLGGLGWLAASITAVVGFQKLSKQYKIYLTEQDKIDENDMKREVITDNTVKSVFCTNCGIKLQAPAKFCHMCGTPAAIIIPQNTSEQQEQQY